MKPAQPTTCSFYEDKSKEVEVELTHILARVTHHIHPKIVQRIVETNRLFKNEFADYCPREIEPETFFYEDSDCVFPGTRRCINNEKNGKWKNKVHHATGYILNDNTYPRYIWAYLCASRGYEAKLWTSSGLNAFELAHVFAHKVDERILERDAFKIVDENVKPYALFTSASNTVLIPKGLTKPTDNSNLIKLAFYKRHYCLYKDVCKLPGLSDFVEKSTPNWYSNLKWIEPKLPVDWELKVRKLLEYRADYLKKAYTKTLSASAGLPGPTIK